LPYRIAAGIFAAAVEEVGFRAGLVHVLDQLFNPATGLVGGSIVFGLAHLLNRFLGQRYAPMHILAATFAGLLFSAAYLQFGLFYVIGIHWSWNSLCGCWITLFKLDTRTGTQVFEGTLTTTFVVITAAIYIMLFPRNLMV
jgi:membrane protease YdiL (CAAX protease family)